MKHVARAALVTVTLLVSAVTTGQAQEQTFTGHLVDTVCATGHAHEDGYATKHENTCNLMPGCIKSGFSLITSDKKALKFDAKGAEQALVLVKKTSKEKDVKATVVGTLKGDTIAVSSISLN